MKYILLLLAMAIANVSSVTTVSADSKSFNFYVGNKNGGGSATMQTMISEALLERGWNINFKVIGNCGQVKNLMETGDEPVLAGWGPDWNSDPANKCYIKPTSTNFVDTYSVNPRFLCGTADTPDFAWQAGKTYKIGVNAGQFHGPAMQEAADKLGVKFTVIEYKNSGAIKKAMAGKEIDVWFTNAGYPNHVAGTQKCFYSTLTTDILDIKPLSTLISNERAFATYTGFLLINDKFSTADKKQLITDVQTVVDSKDYREKIGTRGVLMDDLSIEDQLTRIEKASKAHKK